MANMTKNQINNEIAVIRIFAHMRCDFAFQIHIGTVTNQSGKASTVNIARIISTNFHMATAAEFLNEVTDFVAGFGDSPISSLSTSVCSID